MRGKSKWARNRGDKGAGCTTPQPGQAIPKRTEKGTIPAQGDSFAQERKVGGGNSPKTNKLSKGWPPGANICHTPKLNPLGNLKKGPGGGRVIWETHGGNFGARRKGRGKKGLKEKGKEGQRFNLFGFQTKWNL